MVGRPRSQPAAWLGRPCRPQDGKGKFVWLGGSRQHPMGAQYSLCLTGEDGKVKFGGWEALVDIRREENTRSLDG